MPCGLIVNELASNALKHAFPNGRGGEVTVALAHDAATGVACLRVADTGVGLPAGLDWRQSRSLGLRLVQMLAGQMHGTVTATSTHVSGSGNMTISGNFTNSGTFSQDSSLTTTFDNHTHNLSGAGTTTLGGVTIQGSATVNANAHNFSVTGNWSLTSGGTFNGGTATVTFSGGNAQSIGGSGDTAYNGFTINKTVGTVLTLGDGGAGGNITVNGALTLTSGIIDGAANTKTVTIGTAGTAGTGSSTSHVSGKLLRAWANNSAVSKNFPIGKTGNFRPVTVNYTALSGAPTVSAEQFEATMGGTPPANTTKFTTRYWTIAETVASSSRTFSLTLDGTGFTPAATARILKYDGSTIVAFATSFSSPNYTATGLTSFSDWTLGDECIHSADPTSASASVNPICNGGSTLLTLSGGGGGSIETIHWYTGSCGGTSVGTGNGLSVSPTATTTYYGRYEDGSPCSYNSACQTVTVTVNQKSADPTSASASVNPICHGGSTLLTLNGGGGGTGETIHWYTGSCGGTSAGTGNGLSVSPTTTTTYYGRYEDGSPCSYNSACQTVVVTVGYGPEITGITATEGGDVKNCAAPLSEGTVNITVPVSADCALVGPPTVGITNGANWAATNFVSQSPSGTYNYTWDVSGSTAGGVWTVTVSATNTVGDWVQTWFTCCVAQVTGQLQLEGFDGTGTSPQFTRTNVTFKATAGGPSVTKTWTVGVTNLSAGDTFNYALSFVPAGTNNISAKTPWNLRRKLTGLDLNTANYFQGILNYISGDKLRGGDITGDNKVSTSDYAALRTAFGGSTPSADITGDGTVDSADYTILKNNWYSQGDPE